MAFEKLADLDDIWEGDMETFETADGTEVLLIGVAGGGVKAYQAMCPHQQILLSEGKLENGILICRAHFWQFDPDSGRGINPDDCHLAQYPVQIRDEAVYVDVSGVTPVHAHT